MGTPDGGLFRDSNMSPAIKTLYEGKNKRKAGVVLGYQSTEILDARRVQELARVASFSYRENQHSLIVPSAHLTPPPYLEVSKLC